MIYVIKVTLGKDWSFYKRPYQGWDWTCKELKIVKIKVKMVFKNEFKDSKSNLKTFLRVQLGYDLKMIKDLTRGRTRPMENNILNWTYGK